MTSKFELMIDEDSQGDLDASILIDGVVFGERCIDLDELKKSAISSGGYDLQTCGCGVPGCAGFYAPIFVQHQENSITWEFDSRDHPIPEKNYDTERNTEFSITRYEFNREQYITEIQEKFNWLKNHPKKSSLGPYGFDSAIFDTEVFYHSKPQTPFEYKARIVVGYTDEFRQAWIWIERDSYVSFRVQRFFPSCEMWAKFSDWTSIWDKERECDYPNETTVLVSNQRAEDLAKAIQKYWGDAAEVLWEEIISNSSPCTFVRHHLEV